MRHAATTMVLIGVAFTVASWLVFPGAVGAPPSPAAVSTPDRPDAAPRAVAPPPIEPSVSSPVAAPPAPVSTPPPPDAFLAGLNEVRAAAGVAPLRHDPSLAERADGWAARLAAAGELRHSELIYEVVDEGRWRAAGENVGYGPEVGVLVDAFVASAAHHANMINPDYVAVGIGVVEVDGVLWTAHLFAG